MRTLLVVVSLLLLSPAFAARDIRSTEGRAKADYPRFEPQSMEPAALAQEFDAWQSRADELLAERPIEEAQPQLEALSGLIGETIRAKKRYGAALGTARFEELLERISRKRMKILRVTIERFGEAEFEKLTTPKPGPAGGGLGPYDPAASMQLKGLDPAAFTFRVDASFEPRGKARPRLTGLGLKAFYKGEKAASLTLMPQDIFGGPEQPFELYDARIAPEKLDALRGKGLGTFLSLVAVRLVADLAHVDVVSPRWQHISDDAKAMVRRLEAAGWAKPESQRGSKIWRFSRPRVLEEADRAFQYFLIHLENPEALRGT